MHLCPDSVPKTLLKCTIAEKGELLDGKVNIKRVFELDPTITKYWRYLSCKPVFAHCFGLKAHLLYGPLCVQTDRQANISGKFDCLTYEQPKYPCMLARNLVHWYTPWVPVRLCSPQPLTKLRTHQKLWFFLLYPSGLSPFSFHPCIFTKQIHDYMLVTGSNILNLHRCVPASVHTTRANLHVRNCVLPLTFYAIVLLPLFFLSVH